eukprot:scaffold115305_cov35-Tisochrysis_lutea.AAC.3
MDQFRRALDRRQHRLHVSIRRGYEGGSRGLVDKSVNTVAVAHQVCSARGAEAVKLKMSRCTLLLRKQDGGLLCAATVASTARGERPGRGLCILWQGARVCRAVTSSNAARNNLLCTQV